MQKKRIEKDSLGTFEVPQDAMYGIFTTRALKNFQLTGERAPRAFIRALGLVKMACAETNGRLNTLEKRHSRAISQAAREFSDGEFDDAFPIDVIQAGAGTPFNMNANEIIANRANEILGGKRGTYDPIHPNNHVNASQSTNDVIPTAIRIAALFLFDPLLSELEKLADAFDLIARGHRDVMKVGRTHLEDAVPLTVDQEFGAFATMLRKTRERFEYGKGELLEVGLGGTALGTGITTHPKWQRDVVSALAQITKLPLKPARDLRETSASMNSFVAVSSCCRMLAIDLVKISNDLKLLNMGPLAGLAEITLPEVEPGSSIMPGKVNPSIAEAVHMAAYDVMASDYAIALAAQAGQLQLNVMTPLILKHLLRALHLLASTCAMFRTDCVQGLEINVDRITALYDNSLVTATALSPYLGYEVTAEIVKEALKLGSTIVDVVSGKSFMSDRDLATVLSPDRITKPAILDTALRERILKNTNFQAYREKIRSV